MFNIPLSNGELVDKYTILEIKKEKINDQEKINIVKKEIKLLKEYVEIIFKKYEINNQYKKLKEINNKLWDIEDSIRIKEKKQEFDEEFISIARNVYFNNDIRANIKKQINKLTNSLIEEVKSYEDYKN
jgi:hypothetical protein